MDAVRSAVAVAVAVVCEDSAESVLGAVAVVLEEEDDDDKDDDSDATFVVVAATLAAAAIAAAAAAVALSTADRGVAGAVCSKAVVGSCLTVVLLAFEFAALRLGSLGRSGSALTLPRP